jgi:hypothetical protein
MVMLWISVLQAMELIVLLKILMKPGPDKLLVNIEKKQRPELHFE